MVFDLCLFVVERKIVSPKTHLGGSLVAEHEYHETMIQFDSLGKLEYCEMVLDRNTQSSGWAESNTEKCVQIRRGRKMFDALSWTMDEGERRLWLYPGP